MDSGFYAACAGLVAKTRALDSVAHNLANASTTAFKRERVDFQSLLTTPANGNLNQLNQAINNFGVAASPSPDLTQGPLEQTGSPLDLAVEGPGFLTLQTSSGTAFTRNGHFQLSPTGQLTTAEGDRVMSDQGPITIPPGAVSISAGGVISVNGAIVGTLRMVEFDPKSQFVEAAPGVFRSDTMPVAAAHSALRQGALESANVNPVEGAVGLVVIQRQAEMLQRALAMFHGEMNRVATTDLARV